MKIMFLYASMGAGGAERMISALANYYARKDMEVSIAVIDNHPSFYPLHPKVQLLNLHELQRSRNIKEAIKNNIRLVKVIRRSFKEVRPDCVVCFGINYLLYALMARCCLNIKVVGSERNNPYYNESGFWYRMKKIVSPWADGYIFQTNGARLYYPQSVRRKSRVIPNGIFIDSTAGIVPLTERVKNSICAVGRLHRQKGFDLLIRAFSIFEPTNPGYKLTIYGEGSERSNLADLIDELDLGQKVELAGNISNVQDEIARQQIYILSSRYEGMPNALMEAMACGCACIAADCDFGPGELIEHGENGLLVPVLDIKAMAASMQQLAQDPVLLEKIAQKAVNIRATHSIDNIAEKYLAYLADIV